MIEYAQQPVAFGRLLLEEGAICRRHHKAALPLMRWSTALSDFLAEGAPAPEQGDLYALRHLYLVEAHLVAGKSGLASQELDHAQFFLDFGSGTSELRATWHERAARVLWYQGWLSDADRS
jgi:hypothetical protein